MTSVRLKEENIEFTKPTKISSINLMKEKIAEEEIVKKKKSELV